MLSENQFLSRGLQLLREPIGAARALSDSFSTELEQPVDSDLAIWFRRTLVLKILYVKALSVFQLARGNVWDFAILSVLCLATVSACRKNNFLAGIWVWVLEHIYLVVGTALLASANQSQLIRQHLYLVDLIGLGLILLFPEAASGARSKVSGLIVRTGRFLILTVLFFAGLNKVLYGQWHNGGFIGAAMLFGPDWMMLNRFLHAVGYAISANIFDLGTLPGPRPWGFEVAAINVPKAALIAILSFSYATLIVEILCPVMIFFKKYQRFFSLLLTGFIFASLFITGMYSTVFTVLIFLLLFFSASTYKKFVVFMSLSYLILFVDTLSSERFLPWVWF